eukprot:4880811-Pleurochrysis_carterae.AAC.1
MAGLDPHAHAHEENAYAPVRANSLVPTILTEWSSMSQRSKMHVSQREIDLWPMSRERTAAKVDGQRRRATTVGARRAWSDVCRLRVER